MAASDKTDATPLLWDTTAEPSAFDPDDWFRYCEEVNGRPPPRLPVLGVQSVTPAHLDIAVERYGAKVDDFTLADHPVVIFTFAGVPMVLGISAKGSYAAGGLEEMIAMGVRRGDFPYVFQDVLCPEFTRTEGCSAGTQGSSRCMDGSGPWVRGEPAGS